MTRASNRDTHAELAEQVQLERRRAEADRRAIQRPNPGRRKSDLGDPAWFWWIYVVAIVLSLLGFTLWDRWGRAIWFSVFT